jgi:glycerol-3-phosphate acyltransferase PlsY
MAASRKGGLSPLEAISRFAGHVFSGAVMVLLIAVPAVLLHLLLLFYTMSGGAGDAYLALGFTVLEWIIFGVDAFVFVAYLLVSAYRLIREM